VEINSVGKVWKNNNAWEKCGKAVKK
jgi:hypothetical protein